jgi:hypothetical protein
VRKLGVLPSGDSCEAGDLSPGKASLQYRVHAGPCVHGMGEQRVAPRLDHTTGEPGVKPEQGVVGIANADS